VRAIFILVRKNVGQQIKTGDWSKKWGLEPLSPITSAATGSRVGHWTRTAVTRTM